jgi:hypothetical protein
MDTSQAPRTIYTTYRNRSRFSRIRLRRPGPRPRLGAGITALFPALRVPDDPADYTPELALELLAGTSELPEGKHALFVILNEHHRALHALATQALARTPAAGEPPAAR